MHWKRRFDVKHVIHFSKNSGDQKYIVTAVGVSEAISKHFINKEHIVRLKTKN